VNEAAQRSRQTRFTALLHHVDVEALLRSFRRQRRRAATGIDGVTVEEYARNLESNIKDWIFPKKVDTVKRKVSVSVFHIQPGKDTQVLSVFCADYRKPRYIQK
jgi:hypothetical protein